MENLYEQLCNKPLTPIYETGNPYPVAVVTDYGTVYATKVDRLTRRISLLEPSPILEPEPEPETTTLVNYEALLLGEGDYTTQIEYDERK